MATQKLEMSRWTAAGFLGLVAWTANYVAVQIFGFPFVYCWLSPLLIPIYAPIAGVLVPFAGVALVWYTVKRDYFHAVCAAGFIVALFGIPQWAAILFRMEGSCG